MVDFKRIDPLEELKLGLYVEYIKNYDGDPDKPEYLLLLRKEINAIDLIKAKSESPEFFDSFQFGIVSEIEGVSRFMAISNVYYMDGKILSLEDALREVPDKRNFIESLKADEANAYVMKTKNGSLMPLNNDDEVI